LILLALFFSLSVSGYSVPRCLARGLCGLVLYKDADGVSSLSSLSSFFNAQVSPGIHVLRRRDAHVLAYNRVYLSDCFRYALESNVSLKFMLRVQKFSETRALCCSFLLLIKSRALYYCPFMQSRSHAMLILCVFAASRRHKDIPKCCKIFSEISVEVRADRTSIFDHRRSS